MVLCEDALDLKYRATNATSEFRLVSPLPPHHLATIKYYSGQKRELPQRTRPRALLPDHNKRKHRGSRKGLRGRRAGNPRRESGLLMAE